MLAGGLLYTAGALCYHRRRPDPYPAVFGYHEVFHAYVCAAAACQYVAIALFLTSQGLHRPVMTAGPAACSRAAQRQAR
jgi:predicted membrane channel-forming protein YqfA (hemolysin III family)